MNGGLNLDDILNEGGDFNNRISEILEDLLGENGIVHNLKKSMYTNQNSNFDKLATKLIAAYKTGNKKNLDEKYMTLKTALRPYKNILQ